MEKQLEKLFSNSRDAVLGITDNRIEYANAAAAELFRREPTGEAASRVVGEELLTIKEDSFVASAAPGGRRCTVTGTRLGETLVLRYTPEPTDVGGFASEGLVCSMLAELTTLKLAADHIAQKLEPCGEKEKQYLAFLYHSYYKLCRLAGNLSAAEDLAQGHMPFFPRRTELVSLCGDLVSSVALLLGRKDSVRFESGSERIMAEADEVLIERMLLNLLANALAAVGENGEILVRLEAKGRRAVLSVDDTGAGIPPEVLKNVFSRYETGLAGRMDTTAGAGLGLGIARGIAQLHGGSLIIESREGKGCCVRVMLPAGKMGFDSPRPPRRGGLDAILTELSGLLDSSYYTAEYLD